MLVFSNGAMNFWNFAHFHFKCHIVWQHFPFLIDLQCQFALITYAILTDVGQPFVLRRRQQMWTSTSCAIYNTYLKFVLTFIDIVAFASAVLFFFLSFPFFFFFCIIFPIFFKMHVLWDYVNMDFNAAYSKIHIDVNVNLRLYKGCFNDFNLSLTMHSDQKYTCQVTDTNLSQIARIKIDMNQMHHSIQAINSHKWI